MYVLSSCSTNPKETKPYSPQSATPEHKTGGSWMNTAYLTETEFYIGVHLKEELSNGI